MKNQDSNNQSRNLAGGSSESERQLSGLEALPPKWAGADDELQEKDEGSGAIYDAESGEWLFRVPAEYRVLIVNAVNSYDSLRARVAELEAERKTTRTVLDGCREALQTLPKDALGLDSVGRWSYRDELLNMITAELERE